MVISKHKLTPSQLIIRELSDRIVKAQRPLRILDAVKWSPHTQTEFFKNKQKKLPVITPEYYQKRPLSFNPEDKIAEFYAIERDIRKNLGTLSGVGHIMVRLCQEYREATRMISLRGTPEFSQISKELYGSSEDAFYVGAPSLKDLAVILSHTLENIKNSVDSFIDEKVYSSEDAVNILRERLNKYFDDPTQQVLVKIDDGIVADAAAGADVVKIRRGARFSERDLRILEVHEGWVHVGTTLNGKAQPVCTFLSKGSPSYTIFQEGLAVIMEIFTFVSHPNRIRRLTNRVQAIYLAENGANFLEIYDFFQEQGLSEVESYRNTVRVFRGSTPTLGPFTKDLAYNKGFILIYNYLRLAIQQGLTSRIPLIFLGKTSIEDLHIFENLLEEKTIVPPKYLPPQFRDLAGLTCWMSYSLFLNTLSLDKLRDDYKSIL